MKKFAKYSSFSFYSSYFFINDLYTNKTAGAYYGTIRIGFSWVIPALLFITIVKAGLDNVILRAAGE